MANDQQNEDIDYTIALVLQELEDLALAQEIADSQRGEIYRQQQPPKQNRLDSEREYNQRQQEEEEEEEQQQQQTIPEIQGSPTVSHQVVHPYINYCKEGCDNCRWMMQKVRLIATETEEWCRKNFEVTCYGEHFTLIFWSGARKDRMVVQTVKGEIHVSVTKQSWLMWFKKLAEKCLAAFKCIVAITGTAMKYIGK